MPVQRTLYEADWRIVSVADVRHVEGHQQDKSFPLDINVLQPEADQAVEQSGKEPNGSQVAAPPLNQLFSYLWSVFTWGVSLTDPGSQRFIRWCSEVHSPARLAQAAPMAWHGSRPSLAVVSGSNTVQVFEMTLVRMPDGRAAAHAGNSAARSAAPTAVSTMSTPYATLRHAQQTQVRCVAWRPMARDAVAVGGLGAVCLWHEVDPRVSEAQYTQLVSKHGHVNAGPSAWESTILVHPGGRPVTAMAWHPRGHYLAAGCVSDSTITVWDCRRLQHGPEQRRTSIAASVHLLRWSPCGHYLFVGCTDGTFTIYETLTWEWQAWSHRACGHLVNAIWSEKATPAAILLFCSQQIVAVHLTDAPPGLHAQLMPLDAPQVIESVVWDSKRERLVIALGGSHPLAGHALLFVTSQEPVMSALCVGPIYLPSVSPLAASTGHPEIEAAMERNVLDGPHDACSTQMQIFSAGDAGALVACRRRPGALSVVPMALRDVHGLGLHAAHSR